MRFAKIVFRVAGVYGILVLIPGYFVEQRMGHDYPPPITHPEYYYGFVGVALAFQLVFLLIASDPVRYRPMMLPAVVEKAAYAIAVPILYFTRHVPGMVLGFSMIDGLLGVLFVIAYLRTSGIEK